MIKSIFSNFGGLILAAVLALVVSIFFGSSVTATDDDTLFYIGMPPLGFFILGLLVFTFLVHFIWVTLLKDNKKIPFIIFLVSSALLLITKMELYYLDIISIYCFDRSFFSMGYTIYPPLSIGVREQLLLQHGVNLDRTNLVVDSILVICLIWASMKLKNLNK